MRWTVNGDARDGEARTLQDVWEAEARDLGVETPRGFAMAHNGRVAPKAEWPRTLLAEGDRVEIIRAMAGG